jgi:sulfonate transport system permease protein
MARWLHTPMSSTRRFLPSPLTPLDRSLALVGPLVLLALWFVATRRNGDAPALLASPGDVVAAARELAASGELVDHLRASLTRLGFGFAIGAGLGLVVGVLLGVSRPFAALVSPTFNALRQTPAVAFIPMLVLMFGVEETFKLVLVAKATMFPIALATADGIKNIPRSYWEVARVYQLRGLALLRQVVLPAIAPPIVTGVRVALGRSWMVLVAAEILAAESGLGQMMEQGRQRLRLDVVLVGVLFTGLAGLALERGMRAVERRFARWRLA